MSVAYYLEEHVPKAIAKGLRARGVDVLTVPEASLLGASDLDDVRPVAAEESKHQRASELQGS